MTVRLGFPLLLVACSIACGQPRSSPSTSRESVPPTKSEANQPAAEVVAEYRIPVEMVDEWKANPLAFEKKYAGKRIRLKAVGVATTGRTEDTGEPYIVGTTGSLDYPTIMLFFRMADEDQPASVKVTPRYVMNYRISGKVLVTKDGSIGLEECKIENMKEIGDKAKE